MPGWWFTIESTTTRHFIQQFKTAIEDALRAKPATRAIMRARATKQRFPVRQWVADLEQLQVSAIDISHGQAAKEKRPTLETSSTPAILETPSGLNVLQSRFMKPSLRPRPARPELAQATSQVGGLSLVAEGRLLAGPSPGLGSKMGPSSKRKRPPPPLLRKTIGAVPKIADFAARSDRNNRDLVNSTQRPTATRAPTVPSLVFRHNQNEQETTQPIKRPAINRAPTMPTLPLRLQDRKAIKLLWMQLPANQADTLMAPEHPPASSEQETTQPSERPAINRAPTMPTLPLRLQDRKAFKLLGTQLPADRADTLMAPEHPPASSDDSCSPPFSAINTPSSPITPFTPKSASTGYHTAESSPTATTHKFSNRSSTTAATSVSATNKSTRNSGNWSSRIAPTIASVAKPTKTSVTFASAAKPPLTAPAIAKPIVHTPRAVDKFPSLGKHYFPHGSVAVLSTSEIQEEKPDNMLQNVTPFFSDRKKEYENLFEQNLKKLNGKTSENQLCIEEYLLKSEKSWFGRLRAAELSKASESSPPEEHPTAMVQDVKKRARDDGFGLADNHKPPSGLKRVMRRKIGDWPVYSFLLAFVRNPRPVPDSIVVDIEFSRAK